MTDPHSGNDLNPAGNPGFSPRRRYILRVTAGYAVLAVLWICLSDRLITALVDVAAIYWLSTAKGLLFVVVTTLLLAAALRGVPGEAASRPATPRLESMLAAASERRMWMYGFAGLATVAMLLVRSGIAVSFGDRPLLILFMFPIILSAMAGGLGPGLAATLIAALGAAYCLPPDNSFLIGRPHDLFQWSFLVANGALVSILSGRLHRLRRHTEASLQLQAVTLASIGDGVITTDSHGRITFLNPEAERLTGWTNEEALGQPMASVFRVINEESRQPVEDPVHKILASGEAVGLANHALLLARDGRELPVQDRSAPIRLAGGVMLGVVLVFRDVGERRLAEHALRESETTYRSLFENMLNGFAYCRMLFENGMPQDFVYLSVNHAFEALTGLKDVVGRKVSEIIPGIREADPELFAIYARVALGGAPERFETFVAALGMWFSISVYSPEREHFVAVFDVITERKKGELALRESEKRFRDIAEISADWIWEVDSAGRFTFASENVLNLLGFRAEEIIGKTPFDFMPEEEAARVEGEFRAIMARRDAFRDLDNLNLRKDGALRHVLTSGVPILDDQGILLGYRGLDRDVTEKRQAEAALRESLAEKIALLKEVHHRVKNNLQIVASLLSLQAGRTVNPEAVAVLLDTKNRVRSMALLHEVLYRSGSLARINFAAYVEELCLQLLRTFGRLADRVRVERQVVALSLSLEQAVPCGLIINELVTNALKYGFPDGKSGKVIVAVALNDGQIALSVRDDGVGLPPGFAPETSATLGLQLVMNLAGQLGGQLAWEAVPEGGALFRVRFPALAQERMATPAQQPGKERSP